MKTTTLLISLMIVPLLLFLFVGCSKTINNAMMEENNLKNSRLEEKDNMDIVIKEIQRCEIDWNQIDFPVKLNEDVINLHKFCVFV